MSSGPEHVRDDLVVVELETLHRRIGRDVLARFGGRGFFPGLVRLARLVRLVRRHRRRVRDQPHRPTRRALADDIIVRHRERAGLRRQLSGDHRQGQHRGLRPRHEEHRAQRSQARAQAGERALDARPRGHLGRSQARRHRLERQLTVKAQQRRAPLRPRQQRQGAPHQLAALARQQRGLRIGGWQRRLDLRRQLGAALLDARAIDDRVAAHAFQPGRRALGVRAVLQHRAREILRQSRPPRAGRAAPQSPEPRSRASGPCSSPPPRSTIDSEGSFRRS